MRKLVPGLLIAVVVCGGHQLAAEEKKDGQLKRARDEVRPKSSSSSPPSSPNSPPNRPHHDHPPQHHHSHHHSGGTALWFGWFGNATVEDGSLTFDGPSGPKGLLAYPYADDQRGWQIDGLDAPADPTKPANVRVRQFGGTIRGEYTDGGDGLHRYAGAVSFAIGGVRLEGDLQRYIEHLPGDVTDTLSLGTVGLGFVLPMAGNQLTLMAGGGLSFYHDHYGNENGWYAKAGIELFPIRPLVLSAEVWGGYIADDEYDETETFMGSGRATLGVVWNRFEIYGGWQATWIESVTLDGPTVGMRVWF